MPRPIRISPPRRDHREVVKVEEWNYNAELFLHPRSGRVEAEHFHNHRNIEWVFDTGPHYVGSSYAYMVYFSDGTIGMAADASRNSDCGDMLADAMTSLGVVLL
jgi:hypothetical protein